MSASKARALGHAHGREGRGLKNNPYPENSEDWIAYTLAHKKARGVKGPTYGPRKRVLVPRDPDFKLR